MGADDRQEVSAGYINMALDHVMVSVKRPTMINIHDDKNFVQVVLTMGGALALRNQLDRLIASHGSDASEK